MTIRKLWYDGPSAEWKQGLPIGNGRLGAVVYGGTAEETWSLNESTYWSGRSERAPSRSQGKADLRRAQSLFFAGRYAEGEALAEELFQTDEHNFGTHLPTCEIKLCFDHAGSSCDAFARELNLEEAIVLVSYEADGVRYRRETFATHADGIVASRIASDAPGKVSFSLSAAGLAGKFRAWTERSDTLAFEGQATETMHSDGECGVFARGAIRVAATGGTVRSEEDRVIVEGADEALIYLAMATDYLASDGSWAELPERQLLQAEEKGYERLKRDHVADYRRLYARVGLDLGGPAAGNPDALPTDVRMKRLREGAQDDPQLYALFYQYGRYLTIAGSREDSPLPLNLQGIWNDGEAARMPWSCDYHLDVNTQMNYYPAESGNLAECQLPLARFVERLAEAGRTAAQDFYGCEGWVAHVFTNAWGFAAPGWHYSFGLNVTGGLWLAALVREHYEYTQDQTFLRDVAYPVLKQSALFYLDYMATHPDNGYLVTGPSNSPENSFFPGAPGENSRTLSMGATMDIVLVRELFAFCLSAAGKLDADAELRARLEAALLLLPPLQVGAKGQLQEWLQDYHEAQPDHRHLSHLYALYPGEQITPESTPELAAAARATLDARMQDSELEDVEFTLALFAASLARLGDGDAALKQLDYLIGELCYDNLFTYSKPGIAGAETMIFVVDGNFGGAAAIAEMLLQSRADGEIRLLPALPAAWATGSFQGLRAKGNVEVDVSWTDGRVTAATVKAYSSGRFTLRYGELSLLLELDAGAEYAVDGDLLASVSREAVPNIRAE